MHIAGVEIGANSPCRTVAEISNNHNGDLKLALELIELAAASGADFVKFQAYTSDELVLLRGDGPAPDPWGSQGWTMRDLYKKAATPLHWFRELIAQCERVGIPWFSSVFGVASVAIMEAFGCPVYKLASLDYGRQRIRQLVQKTGKPIIQSHPGPKPPKGGTAYYLYCPPGYPQTDLQLRHVKRYGGFSYHGTNPAVPFTAAALGAKLIECHFQHYRTESELESNVSLTAVEFELMVQTIREMEKVI